MEEEEETGGGREGDMTRVRLSGWGSGTAIEWDLKTGKGATHGCVTTGVSSEYAEIEVGKKGGRWQVAGGKKKEGYFRCKYFID